MAACCYLGLPAFWATSSAWLLGLFAHLFRKEGGSPSPLQALCLLPSDIWGGFSKTLAVTHYQKLAKTFLRLSWRKHLSRTLIASAP